MNNIVLGPRFQLATLTKAIIIHFDDYHEPFLTEKFPYKIFCNYWNDENASCSQCQLPLTIVINFHNTQIPLWFNFEKNCYGHWSKGVVR